MNVEDAAYDTVHDYPGGSESLAPRLGMTAAVLRNKVNRNNDRNALTLEEARRLMARTDDHRILQALAAEFGYGLLRFDAGDEASAPLVGMILNAHAAGGEFSRVVADALSDGVITPNEMQAIQRAGHAEQAALIALVQRLRSLMSNRQMQ